MEKVQKLQEADFSEVSMPPWGPLQPFIPPVGRARTLGLAMVECGEISEDLKGDL